MWCYWLKSLQLSNIVPGFHIHRCLCGIQICLKYRSYKIKYSEKKNLQAKTSIKAMLGAASQSSQQGNTCTNSLS